MGARPDLLLRFLLLYGTLYCSFGLSSPFLPEFLTLRAVQSRLGFCLVPGRLSGLFLRPSQVGSPTHSVFFDFSLVFLRFWQPWRRCSICLRIRSGRWFW